MAGVGCGGCQGQASVSAGGTKLLPQHFEDNLLLAAELGFRPLLADGGLHDRLKLAKIVELKLAAVKR